MVDRKKVLHAVGVDTCGLMGVLHAIIDLHGII